MVGFFESNRFSLKLVSLENKLNSGFRKGQLGAVHAVVSHFSIDDCGAIVCLPTGYGKTPVITALPFVMGVNRLLVVTPSNALRRQVYENFKDLYVLRRIGVVDDGIDNPKVHKLEKRFRSEDEWDSLKDMDVVVTTPMSASPLLSKKSSSDFFDMVIFDEAHHAPANTWNALIEHFKYAKFIFATATPFRTDGKIIPGKLIYNYPVSKALKEGAFCKVNIKTIKDIEGADRQKCDKMIAHKAVSQLNEDRENEFDHRLFVRADSIAHAAELVGIYNDLGVKVQSINSKMGRKAQESCERRLREGSLLGIVCVDMFGEGYDFPLFKVAALHSPHKSLVPTIQFIGRFARFNNKTGEATLIAPEQDIDSELGALLSEGVDIAEAIDIGAAERVGSDNEQRRIVEDFKVVNGFVSDYKEILPSSFRFYSHVVAFKCLDTPDFKRLESTIGKTRRIERLWVSDIDQSCIVFGAAGYVPSWISSQKVFDKEHFVLIAKYFLDSKICFIGSSVREDRVYRLFMDAVCSSYQPISYEDAFYARSGLEDVVFYNIGLKGRAYKSQTESYRMISGPSAASAISVGDSRAFSQGHYFGSGTIDGERVTIGASSRARIWSNKQVTVTEFLRWMSVVNSRILGRKEPSKSQLDSVVIPLRVEEISSRVVVAGEWSSIVYKNGMNFRVIKDGCRCFEGNLLDCDMSDFHVSNNMNLIYFSVVCDFGKFNFSFDVNRALFQSELSDDCMRVEVEVFRKCSSSWIEISEWFCDFPPVFYFDDLSSFESVNLIQSPSLVSEGGGGDYICAMNWDGCDISVEFLLDDGSDGYKRKRKSLDGKYTVQEFLEASLKSKEGVILLFYDHRAGEAADYVSVVDQKNGKLLISLYHCKAAGGLDPGNRVSDVYELMGQMIKSVKYCETRTLVTHMERRTSVRHSNPSRFLIGSLDGLRSAFDKKTNIDVDYEIVGVQPGISEGSIKSSVRDLMVAPVDYVKTGGSVRAYWLVNE